MPIPATTQDIVKGIDFTGAATGTASEHNQLVDQSVPYTDGTNEEEGIGFIITTTDTALNTPSVPNPAASASYNKWKRYIWNRRPFHTATTLIPSAYMWIDAAVNDTTFRHWIALDPALYTTIGGGTGTPLQTALDYLNTQIGISNAASTAAQATANVAAGNIGTMIGTQTLQQQITSANGTISTLETEMNLVYTAISGDTTNINASGGINGQLASLQSQLTLGLATYKSVANITPGTVIGSFIRTNATGAFTEWYDPSAEHFIVTSTASSGSVSFTKGVTTALTLDAAVSIPAGVYKVTGAFQALLSYTNGGDTNLTGQLKLAGSAALSFMPVLCKGSGGSRDVTVCMTINGIITIPKATGSQAISAELTVPNYATLSFLNTVTSGVYFSVIFERLYLPQA